MKLKIKPKHWLMAVVIFVAMGLFWLVILIGAKELIDIVGEENVWKIFAYPIVFGFVGYMIYLCLRGVAESLAEFDTKRKSKNKMDNERK